MISRYKAISVIGEMRCFHSKKILNPYVIACGFAIWIALFSYASAPAVAANDSGETITLSLENTDIKHLIQWASAYIDKTIIVHPSVQGKITVIAGEPIPASQVGKIFQSVLQVYGYIAIETGDTIKVLPDTFSSMAATDVVDEAGEINAVIDDKVITRIFQIQHQSAESLITKFKPFLTSSAVFSTFPDSNTILIADRAQNVRRIEAFLRQVDQPSDKTVKIIQLQHSRAEDVLARLKEIMPSQGQDTQTQLTYAADPRTNSIILSGYSGQFGAIMGIVRRLDAPGDYQANTQVIFLDYAKATDMVTSLTAVSKGIQARYESAGQINSEIIIEVNEEHNALVITATAEAIDELRQVIQQLDRRRMQVLVEALIVEVNEEVAQDLGVEWRALLDFDGGYAGNSSLTKNLTTPDLPGLGSGLTLGFLKSDETGLLIRALETSGAANVLSKPTIVSLDNEEASILVGENVPFITGSSTGSASSTSNPFQTITRQDIGITLSIKPQINLNRSITLEIEQKVESLSDSITSTADVVTNKREIQTKVLIEHDQILVLGGLIRDELHENQQGVPVLSRIPLLGRLFRGDATQVRKNNLMVFIHPRILDSSEEIDITTKRYIDDIGTKQDYINEKIDTFLIPVPGDLPNIEQGISTQNRYDESQESAVEEEQIEIKAIDTSVN